MAWAPNLENQFREAAEYVVRILDGAKPGDLPIRYPRARQDSAQGVHDQRLTVSATDAPRGIEIPTVQWVKVSAPLVGVMLAAIALPAGEGPFPAVLLLHGTHGFAPQYVRLGEELSRGGLLVVTACWFSGGSGEGSRFVPPIACP